MPLDRMRIEKDANCVLTNEILGAIIVPDALPKELCKKCSGTGNIPDWPSDLGSEPQYVPCDQCKGSCHQPVDPQFFPPIDRPLQERYEWWKNRGIIKDPDDRYPIYYAIAKQLAPYLIAEVGVYYGYSLMAMAKGALAGGSQVVSVNGFDTEQYAPGCLEWVRQAFMTEKIGCNLMRQDSLKMESFPLHMIQLSSIDGDHSYESAMNDLVKMEKCMVPRPRMDAVHIVDDTGWALNVRQAAEDFAAKYGYSVMHIPTHKGTSVLERV